VGGGGQQRQAGHIGFGHAPSQARSRKERGRQRSLLLSFIQLFKSKALAKWPAALADDSCYCHLTGHQPAARNPVAAAAAPPNASPMH
jgi:hypothetical protein